MIRGELFRSAGFRFALIYALLLVLSAMALALFLWWATAGFLDREIESDIKRDAQGLAERWQYSGIAGLISAIEDRVAQNVDDNAIYLLADAKFRQVAGNLQFWPQQVGAVGKFFEMTVYRSGLSTAARLQRFDVPGGYHLLVGRDAQVSRQLRVLLSEGLLWAAAIVILMASVGALLVRNLFLNAMFNISATANAIASGDLAQRVKLSGRRDDFDQLAETINDMLDRIERLMDGVRQVSNAIAHDLRTPIARARTRLEDAALHGETASELRAAIERATADLDDIVRVFQALLRIAEIEAGARRSNFARIDIVPLLAGVDDLYGIVAEERGIKLIPELPPRLEVYGDKALLQQAVANLVDNAVKFSPPGGIVRLTASQSATSVQIVVADQGPGIPEADRAKAAERFYRGEAARNTPGSGLGLSLVQAVAGLHNGALHLENANPGLRAVLTLPQAEYAGNEELVIHARYNPKNSPAMLGT